MLRCGARRSTTSTRIKHVAAALANRIYDDHTSKGESVEIVAHSMGGTVITNAAAGKSNVKALVYISAFVPDVGETQGDLINKSPAARFCR